MWSEVNIGSNLIRNTTGIIRTEGREEPLLHVERGDDDQLLLTADLYDDSGVHVAKLRRNAWAFGESDRYEVTTNPNDLSLIDRETGQTVLRASVVDRDRITISEGRLRTPDGRLIEIDSTALRVEGTTMAGNVFDAVGDAIRVGSTSIGIG